jgi:hypothetical protein
MFHDHWPLISAEFLRVTELEGMLGLCRHEVLMFLVGLLSTGAH